MSSESESLRALVGGRWAVSWQGYLLAWPWAVLFIFSATPSLWVSDTVLAGLIRGIAAGTMTYVPVGLVLWLAAVTVLRCRRAAPVSVALVALVGGIAWTARTVAVLILLHIEGLPSTISPASRFLAGFIQGAIATLLAAWLFATISRFHTRRRALLNELVREELAADHLAESLQRMRTDVLAEVRRAMDESVRTLDDRRRADTPTAQELDALAGISRRMSRDLANRLWADAAHTARVHPLTVVRSAVRHRPFAYWALIPGTLLGLLVLPIYWGLPNALIAVSIVTVVSVAISASANALTPRLQGMRAMVAYALAIVLLLSTAAIMQVTMSALQVTSPSGNALLWAVAVNFGVLYPMIGVGAHVGRAQREALNTLRQSISTAEIRREALWREESRTRRGLAVSLHGGLQADLTASTMRAQHALDHGDQAAARASLAQARSLIGRTIDLPQRDHADLRCTVQTVTDTWDGIVDITTDIRLTREPSAHCVAMLQEVLLEGIGNAVRHGCARTVAIRIVGDQGDFRVSITDNGRGFDSATPGLGSSILDQLAPNSWSLKPSPTGGSTLCVRIRESSAF